MEKGSTPSAGGFSYVDAIAKLGVKNVPPGGADGLRLALEMAPEATHIVDLGCNTGWSSVEIARLRSQATVIGFDLSAHMIDAANLRLSKNELTDRVQFEVMDCTEIDRRIKDAELIFCFGSTAFVDDLPKYFSSVFNSMSSEGCFIDFQYTYLGEVPVELKIAEKQHVQLPHGCKSAEFWLRKYEDAGFILSRFVCLSPFQLTETSEAIFYRKILSAIPEFTHIVEDMVNVREIARSLTPYRRPAIFELRTKSHREVDSDQDQSTDYRNVLDIFASPIPRVPIETILTFNPYEFLAYVGDPDAAPGGAASVGIQAEMLRQLGLDADARILDVGSFTGLSTFVLGRRFNNVVGVDIEPSFVFVARTLAKVFGYTGEFLEMDARSTSFGAGEFDCVTMTATLGYSPDPAGILREAARIIRPSGLLSEFLYHYPYINQEMEDRLRSTVSPYIRMRSLSEQVQEVESLGFRLLRADALVQRTLSAEKLSASSKHIVERERDANPSLDSDDLEEFEYLVQQNLIGNPNTGFEPVCYCCVFERVAD
jgi:SAM-dependent methyltransferase